MESNLKKYSSLHPRYFYHMTAKYFTLILFFALLLTSCGNNSPVKAISESDLQFGTAKDAKDYSDMVLKALRTNRDKVILDQFTQGQDIDGRRLDVQVNAYSQSFGKKDWEYRDEFDAAGAKDMTKGFDYSWYDKRGRIAMQVNVLPESKNGTFKLKKLEFRSRIDVLESEAFPGGKIDDYKKIN